MERNRLNSTEGLGNKLKMCFYWVQAIPTRQGVREVVRNMSMSTNYRLCGGVALWSDIRHPPFPHITTKHNHGTIITKELMTHSIHSPMMDFPRHMVRRAVEKRTPLQETLHLALAFLPTTPCTSGAEWHNCHSILHQIFTA